MSRLPIKQTIINSNIERSRENLIRGQLHLQFLTQYLDKISNKELPATEFIFPIEEIEKQKQLCVEQNQYYLEEMKFYKGLKEQNIKKKEQKILSAALDDYEKLPETFVIKDEMAE